MTKFFWRDATGHEIDVLIDTGEWVIPVEVKSGQTVAGDVASSIRDGTGAVPYFSLLQGFTLCVSLIP